MTELRNTQQRDRAWNGQLNAVRRLAIHGYLAYFDGLASLTSVWGDKQASAAVGHSLVANTGRWKGHRGHSLQFYSSRAHDRHEPGIIACSACPKIFAIALVSIVVAARSSAGELLML